jgi:ATP-binding cassette, subfamily C (CFTR/MRP), member 4
MAITFCTEGYVSSRRLKEFLLIKETKPTVKKENDSIEDIKKANLAMNPPVRTHKVDSNEKGAINFKDVTAAWINDDGESTTGLSSIDLRIEPGSLYAIVGSVGSGKTSLLHAILGELDIDSGSLEINGALSYANQESFIFEGSIRSNILFTEKYEPKRFSEVVSVCGLAKDFEMFEHGDQTLVGEKGISLSGGQKARINLARAVYKQADIYLLDDPLSAVDSHVGKSIFKECILKFLKGKTVLLVTHQVHHLSKVQNILVVANGQIKANGSYRELEKLELPLLMAADSPQHEKKENEDENLNNEVKSAKKRLQSETESLDEDRESQEEGSVSLEVYKKYFKAIQSLPLVIFMLILRMSAIVFASMVDYSVAQWVNWEEIQANQELLSGVRTNTTDDLICTSPTEDERQRFVNYYIMTIAIFVIVIFSSCFVIFYTLIRASKNLHDYMFRGLTKTFMKFFNKNSSGRILNRFSKDISRMDTELPTNFFDFSSVGSSQF